MPSEESLSVAERAKQLYETKLQTELEKEFMNQFVAIEPDSGQYFVSDSLSDAVQQAKHKHPEKISFVVRVGHPAAVHIGLMAS